MNPSSKTSAKGWRFQGSVQDYLSFGYMYLLAVGLIHDIVFYKHLGINILKYSSITDVLLSPLVSIVDNQIILAVIVGLMVVLILTKTLLVRLKKSQDQKDEQSGKKTPAYAVFLTQNFVLMGTAISVFSMYIGLGHGKGMRTAKDLSAGSFKMQEILHFEKGHTQKVHIVGQNSLYVFYVEEGKQDLAISPIEGTIRKIEKNTTP